VPEKINEVRKWEDQTTGAWAWQLVLLVFLGVERRKLMTQLIPEQFHKLFLVAVDELR
jgi:hypothetical protein